MRGAIMAAEHKGVEIPAREYAERTRRVQEELRRRKLDIGVGYATPFMPGAMQYLTGFEPHIETAALAVGPGGVYILGGPEIAAMARPAIRHGSIRIVHEFQVLPQHYANAQYVHLREALSEAAGGSPIRRVGILVRPEFLPLQWVRLLRQAVDEEFEFVDAQGILDEMRYAKSPAEMEAFRQASHIATDAMKAMLAALQPGMTELEVAAIGDKVAKEAGAADFGFDTMVMSGPRINTVVGRATNRRIGESEMVSIGVSPRLEGYTSTIGRTVVAGKALPEQVAFLDQGYRGMEIAVQHLRAGTPARELEEAVAAHFRDVGLHDYVAYSVLHGIGLTEVLDEKVPRGEEPIAAGTTLMLDVGLFFHPRFHGLRHEDPFLIHPDGRVERMTDLPVTVYRR